MNFLLNKIDTDIRRKIYEKTKDGKVHGKSTISINKDSEKQKKKFFNEYLKDEEIKNKKRKITIDVSKVEVPTISLIAEKEEDINLLGQGIFLDIKK